MKSRCQGHQRTVDVVIKAQTNGEVRMSKVLGVFLGFLAGGTFAQEALAKTTCEQRREVCYFERRHSQSRAARCDVNYDKCIRAASIEFGYPPVSPVVGLGTPMMQPYPTGKVQVNPGLAAANAVKAANARAAKSRTSSSPPKSAQ